MYYFYEITHGHLGVRCWSWYCSTSVSAGSLMFILWIRDDQVGFRPSYTKKTKRQRPMEGFIRLSTVDLVSPELGCIRLRLLHVGPAGDLIGLLVPTSGLLQTRGASKSHIQLFWAQGRHGFSLALLSSCALLGPNFRSSSPVVKPTK